MTPEHLAAFTDSTGALTEERVGRAGASAGRVAFWIVAAWTLFLAWSMTEIHRESNSILAEIWGQDMDDPYLDRYRPVAHAVWKTADPCLSSGFLWAVFFIPFLGGIWLVQRRLTPLKARWVPWGLLGLGLLAVAVYAFAFFTLLMLPLGRL
ncbi:MAG: hypothetical protein AAB074_21115 [Planctomycetota bacterium]